MGPIEVRPARAGDGAALQRLHGEMAAYYTALITPDLGATRLQIDYQASPLSMPFWTERSGYEVRSVNLRKVL